MDCYELIQMGSRRAIIEGDPFSSIQWGQGKAHCPWRLTDWLDKVHQISKQQCCTIQHLLQEANDVGWSRKGRSFILIFSVFSLVWLDL